MSVSQGSQQLIAPIAAAVTESKIISIIQEMLPAFIFGTGLTGTDSVPIQVATDEKGTNKEAFFQDGIAVALTATRKGFSINVPVTIVIDKPITAGTVGIFMNLGVHA